MAERGIEYNAESTIMNFAGGFILIAVAAAMVLVARPMDGESARFLKGPWIIGQFYVLITMICSVLGISAIIVNWP
jgi:hypothetical protein